MAGALDRAFPPASAVCPVEITGFQSCPFGSVCLESDGIHGFSLPETLDFNIYFWEAYFRGKKQQGLAIFVLAHPLDRK